MPPSLCSATHTTSVTVKQKPPPFGLFPPLYRLHVHHLVGGSLKYECDVVSVSPVDVDRDVGEWQAAESRMRLWQLRVDLRPSLSLAESALPLNTVPSFFKKYIYNK